VTKDINTRAENEASGYFARADCYHKVSKTGNHISAEKKKKRKRRISLLIVALIAILLATVLMFWYTHQTGTEREKYSVYVENEVCNVTVTETLPSKLDIYIDSKNSSMTEDYTVWVEKNITFHVTQELESNPEIHSEENESSIIYHIYLKNCSFDLNSGHSWAMITFIPSEERFWRDYLFDITIKEHFTSFFMEFETFKEDK